MYPIISYLPFSDFIYILFVKHDIITLSLFICTQTSNHLQELNLSTNDISDIAMAPLLEALSSNTSLCSLWLYCNRFTQRGGDTLLQWIKGHRSRLTGLNLIGTTYVRILIYVIFIHILLI